MSDRRPRAIGGSVLCLIGGPELSESTSCVKQQIDMTAFSSFFVVGQGTRRRLRTNTYSWAVTREVC